MSVAPVAETGFNHRLIAYKFVGHFFGLSHRGIIRSKIVFLESVTFQSHARMLSSQVAQVNKKLWTLFGLWGRDSSWVTAMFNFSGETSERTTRLKNRQNSEVILSGTTVCTPSRPMEPCENINLCLKATAVVVSYVLVTFDLCSLDA